MQIDFPACNPKELLYYIRGPVKWFSRVLFICVVDFVLPSQEMLYEQRGGQLPLAVFPSALQRLILIGLVQKGVREGGGGRVE